MAMMKAAQRDWVVAAARRAEARSRGQMPSPFRQSTHQSVTQATQLQQLIRAILDPQITRKQLRQLADAIKTSRVS
jgi:hypothetical protein